jgi:hypothetical protein
MAPSGVGSLLRLHIVNCVVEVARQLLRYSFCRTVAYHPQVCISAACLLRCRAGTYDNQIRKWIKEDVIKSDINEDADLSQLGSRLLAK